MGGHRGHARAVCGHLPPAPSVHRPNPLPCPPPAPFFSFLRFSRSSPSSVSFAHSLSRAVSSTPCCDRVSIPVALIPSFASVLFILRDARSFTNPYALSILFPALSAAPPPHNLLRQSPATSVTDDNDHPSAIVSDAQSDTDSLPLSCSDGPGASQRLSPQMPVDE